MAQQKNNRGFTIVELLIVIVVIAILATITIIGFNGVQNRARNTTAKETASSLQKKLEAYNAVKGEYPTPTASTVAGLASGMSSVDEAKLETSLTEKMVAPSATTTADNPVKYVPCGDPKKGGTVSYFQTPGTATTPAWSYIIGSGC